MVDVTSGPLGRLNEMRTKNDARLQLHIHETYRNVDVNSCKSALFMCTAPITTETDILQARDPRSRKNPRFAETKVDKLCLWVPVCPSCISEYVE